MPKHWSCFISIIRPGTLKVTIARPLELSYVAAIIDKGELIIPKDASAQRFREILAETFKLKHISEADRLRYPAQLLEIIHAMCFHKHGGTLVIVPDAFEGKHIT